LARDSETACRGRCDGRSDLPNSAEKAAETARAAEAHGQPVITINADSADPKPSWMPCADIARFGHLDILVVNAAF